MRIIGKINHREQGLIFSEFLNKCQIAHQVEIQTNQDWGSPDYGICECTFWIKNEDQVSEARHWLTLFTAEPFNPVFAKEGSFGLFPSPISSSALQEDTPLTLKNMTSQHIPWSEQPLGKITSGIILVCTILLFLSEYLMPNLGSQINKKQYAVFISPVEKNLIYDYPHQYELIERYIQLYSSTSDQNLPASAGTLAEEINRTPVWKGLYSYFFNIEQTETSPDQQLQLFEKIREGEVWRLFTPALLHGDLLHLFFNMIWMITLGKQIEQRLSAMKYLLLILLLGIFSNTLQYLGSGPNFVGFSGVICGMLTFIWERTKIAPWEGYDLSRMTYLFMLIFIFGMAALQFIFFLMQTAFNLESSFLIANIAHLSGALMGYFLGRTNFFSWRQS